jgi:hypothetical protein
MWVGVMSLKIWGLPRLENIRGSACRSPLEAICSRGHAFSSGSQRGDEVVRQGWVGDHSNAPSSRLQGWPRQKYKVISDNPWARNHLGTIPKHWQGPFISRSGCAAGKPAAIQATGRGPGVFATTTWAACRIMSAIYSVHVARYPMHVKIHVPDRWCRRSDLPDQAYSRRMYYIDDAVHVATLGTSFRR